jgi:hypothetical protein
MAPLCWSMRLHITSGNAAIVAKSRCAPPVDCRPRAVTLRDADLRSPSRARRGPVAQWLEPAAHNGLVAGSSPAGPTNIIRGFLHSGPPAKGNRPKNRPRYGHDMFHEGLLPPQRDHSAIRRYARLCRDIGDGVLQMIRVVMTVSPLKRFNAHAKVAGGLP